MFSAAKLTQDQKDELHRLAAEGASMSDLQRHLKEAHGVAITYMDTRFLVLDLGIELKSEAKEPEKPAAPAEEEVPAAAPASGAVSVTMDQLALPGALVSGRVTFSDGETGIWMLDQSGRPGLDPDTPGYRPSQQDIVEFQTQLRGLLEKGGF